MAFWPVGLWQHVVNYIEATDFDHRQSVIQPFVLARHGIAKYKIEAFNTFAAQEIQSSGRH